MSIFSFQLISHIYVHHSSSVNGNGVEHHSNVYTEQEPAAAAPISKKEPKKKASFFFVFSHHSTYNFSCGSVLTWCPRSTQEVIESVVALTSNEEERRGVAATLLAPLIPEEVKEAEEKWRKKALAMDENVDAQDLEGEGTPSMNSPALQNTDSQSNQRSQNQSAESSDREEEAEEDTMELELALERKKVSCIIRHDFGVSIQN